jgi:hypothetical protein
MTLSVRSSSLHDTNKLQRGLALVGILAASLVIAAMAALVASSIKGGSVSSVSPTYDADFRAEELGQGALVATSPTYDPDFRAEELGQGAVVVNDSLPFRGR